MKDNIFNKYPELLSLCEKLCREKIRAVIAIDGRAASGKSTLACALADKLGGHVVHVDDFFLPFDMRTAARLGTPGGNFHSERMITEVVTCLDSAFEYGVYSCAEGKITKKRQIGADGPVIIEGAYSTSPVLGKYYDIAIFLTASFDCRMSRIKARNGMLKARAFEDKWIPLEEAYFEAFAIEESADMIIDTTDV